jgi:hypothetical protein
VAEADTSALSDQCQTRKSSVGGRNCHAALERPGHSKRLRIVLRGSSLFRKRLEGTRFNNARDAPRAA